MVSGMVKGGMSCVYPVYSSAGFELRVTLLGIHSHEVSQEILKLKGISDLEGDKYQHCELGDTVWGPVASSPLMH